MEENNRTDLTEHMWVAEMNLILDILEIAWLTEDEMIKDPMYEEELKVRWYWFDTLVWVLAKKYNYSQAIYNTLRWPSSYKNNLIAVKKLLEKLENWDWEVVEKVDKILH
mgnify:FL=1